MSQRRSNPRSGSHDAWDLRLTPDQCRAARGLLDMTRNQLATEAHVSLATLLQFENGERAVKLRTQSLIRMALEANGVLFIPEGDGGVGVRFRDRGTHVALPPVQETDPGAAEEGQDDREEQGGGCGGAGPPAAGRACPGGRLSSPRPTDAARRA